MSSTELITQDGEIIETGVVMMLDDAMAGTLARAEIDMAIATAHKYPRKLSNAIQNILTLATLDEQTAVENIYALVRSGKPLRGPSIRLAEIIATQWGNCRVDARVIAIDRIGKTITAEGMFHDLESNVATRSTVTRSIATSKGALFKPDMIAVAGNAACSIAKRNAILAGVPKGVWRKAVDASEEIIRGDAKTLVERRERAIKALAHFGLTPDQVFLIMEVEGEADIGLDELVTLFAIYQQLKGGETTVEDLLRKASPAVPAHETVSNPLADEKPKDPAPDAKADTAKPKEGEIIPPTGGGPRGSTAEKAAQREGEGKSASGSAEGSAASTGQAGGEGGTAETGSAAGAESAEPVAQEKIDAAYVAGEAAKAKGQTAKSVPKAYSAPEKEAWLAGFEGRDLREEGAE